MSRAGAVSSLVRSVPLLCVPLMALACSAGTSAPSSPAANSAAPAAHSTPAMPAAAAAALSVGAAPAPAAGHGPATGHAPSGAHGNEVLHRLKKWSDRVVQGAQPDGDAAFKEIAAQGCTTVLSVDGAIPDVDTAAKYGLKYVHVPIGYDGISADEQARIIKAVADSKGGVFVHCHHGQHRGPAAAAIARIAVDGVSHDEAYKGLEETCSKSYTGLYETVKDFVPPTREQLAALPPLPSAVRPGGVKEAMVHIDERWEYFKALKAASWAPLADAPDISPPHEASILRELFVEMDRMDETKGKGEDFIKHSAEAQKQLAELGKALAAKDAAASLAGFDAVTASCKACHVDYRD